MFVRKFVIKLIITMLFCCMTANFIYYEVKAEAVNVLVATENGTESYTTEPVRLVINGIEMKNLLMPAVNLTGTTYVPVADIFTQLGAEVTWNEHLREVYIGYKGMLVALSINDKIANINGLFAEMPEPTRIMNDKTMVPVRFIAENGFGFQVDWIDETRTVSISTTDIDDSLGNIIESPSIEDDGEIIITDPTEKPDLEKLAIDISDKSIEYENHFETEIVSLTIPQASSSQIFEIHTSSPISGVSKLLLEDNRLIIDVENAKMGLSQSTYAVNNVNCETVRVGQFQAKPVKIARVVFDLKSYVSYKVYISDDRKTVYVQFSKNTVTNVKFETDGVADYVKITAKSKPEVSVFTLMDPYRLVIDVQYSDLSTDVLNDVVTGMYSKAIKTGQFDDNTARVVIELTATAAYQIDYQGNTAIVKITEPSYKNIWYDKATRSIIMRKDQQGSLVPGSIELQDMYYNYRYKIVLPGDYSGYFGDGDYHVSDDYVSAINIATIGGRTEIVIDEKKILAVIVSDDNENISFKLVLPKEKYNKIVVVDPGHGNGDVGTSGSGVLEKDVNLAISNKLVSMLESDGRIKVYATRVADTYPTLSQRAEMANELGDLFVSIHNNHFDNPAVNGTEIYYYTHTNDSTIGISSKQVAEIFMKNLAADLGSRNRGERIGNFEVLRSTKIPAILCEIGYLSNSEEAAKLATDQYRQRSAESIYKSILEVFNKYMPSR